MSNTGQALSAVAGTVIGFFVGGPTGAYYGFQIGLGVGTLIAPTQLPGVTGPRLLDQKTTTAQLGAAVPEVFGTDAVSGTVIWMGPVREVATTEEVGGKGGPEQDVTTYTYFQPIAIGLCRGPMGGIKQIFENGKLVYDLTPQRADESDVDYENRLIASAEYGKTFELYLGDEEQLPDPTIEMHEGVGKTPAFRGLMYVVYPDRELKDDQGRRHPNFKFVVYDQGAVECEVLTQYSNDVLYPWLTGLDPVNPLNNHVIYQVAGDSSGVGDPAYDFQPSTISEILAASEAYTGQARDVLIAYQAPSSALNFPHQIGGLSANQQDGPILQLHYERHTVDSYFHYTVGGTPCSWPGVQVGGYYYGWQQSLNFMSDIPADNPTPALGTWKQVAKCTGGNYYFSSPVLKIQVQRLPAAPADACEGLPDAPGLPGFCIDEDGRYISAGEWDLDEVPYRVLSKANPVFQDDVIWNTDNFRYRIYPLNPARPVGHEDDTEEFWTAAYEAAVARGDMPEGLEYETHYPVGLDYGYKREATVCTVQTGRARLADVVSRICSRVGLDEGDIDVEDLEEIFIVGYTLARVMTARDAIEPLRMVGFFDLIESGRVLRFATRGKPSVRTLTVDDIGAFPYGEDPGPSITTTKKQDVELPRRVRFHYRAPSRDYEDGQQDSPSRLTTESVNDMDIECSVALLDEMAAQCAEFIWADAWASRWVHTFASDQTQFDLECGDAVVVPVDGRLERVRIVAINDMLPNLRRFEAVRDDDGVTDSVAIADPPVRPPSRITIYAQTELVLLDLPALRQEDNDAGIYAAARRSTPNTWSGASIYRSSDAGATFSPLAAITNEATMGLLASALPEGTTLTWDDENEILVDVQSGSFESRTDADLLELGVNALAIGAHGRWELVQFGQAEQVTETRWRLTHLLRGRRGTEHFCGTGLSGDFVVLVTGVGIIRLPLTNNQLETELVYRAVTLGASFSTGVDTSFTSDGVALLPFSPVLVRGDREDNGDITLSWTRRDRLGFELQSGQDVPESDLPTTYEIDIFEADSSSVLVRTLESETESVTYTAAQQLDDFGAETPELLVRIYQISTIVGRGTPAEATV